MEKTQHTPGQLAAKSCMEYLMENKSLSCWRAEDVVAIGKIIDQKTSAPELLEACVTALWLLNEKGGDKFRPYGEFEKERQIIQQAIAKAEGME